MDVKDLFYEAGYLIGFCDAHLEAFLEYINDPDTYDKEGLIDSINNLRKKIKDFDVRLNKED